MNGNHTTLPLTESGFDEMHQAPGLRQSAEFQVPLRDLIRRRVVSIDPAFSVSDAARLMRDEQVTCLVITDTPYGIVTEGDLCERVLAAGRSAITSVAEVMTTPALTLPAESLIIEGLMTMLDHDIRHLPITENGQVVGVITQSDVLRRQSYNPLFLPQQLKRATTLEDLQAYSSHVTATVGTLLDAGARIRDIGRVVAVAHDALLQRLLHDAEADLGTPPCPYGWLVLGSEGRYEQTLRTDQDNALVYADDAPPDAEDYFAALAQQVVGNLVACGFPLCPGDIMATNPRWRQPLGTWQRYFEQWIRVPDEEALLQAVIFFDYRQVYGGLAVDAALRPIIEEGREHSLFMARFAKASLQHTAPLNFFRRFVRESDGTTHDLVDLKHRGTAPIVDMARLFALEAGCSETNTFSRLHRSVEQSSLSQNGAEELGAAFELISHFRLRHQYGQLQRGEEVTNLVSLATLSPRAKRELKQACVSFDAMQRNVMYIFKMWDVA